MDNSVSQKPERPRKKKCIDTVREHLKSVGMTSEGDDQWRRLVSKWPSVSVTRDDLGQSKTDCMYHINMWLSAVDNVYIVKL